MKRNETPVPPELDAEIVDLIRKLLIKLPILADRDDDVGIAARDLESIVGFYKCNCRYRWRGPSNALAMAKCFHLALIQQLEAAIPADVTDELRRLLRAKMAEKPLSKQQVAQMTGIHQRTLSRRLKSEGTSFKLVVNEARLGTAKQLLADTNMSLAQISATLEFSEPAAFTHAFRRWTGTTASA